MNLVPLFDLKFLRRTRGTRCRNFKSAALARARGRPGRARGRALVGGNSRPRAPANPGLWAPDGPLAAVFSVLTHEVPPRAPDRQLRLMARLLRIACLIA